MEEAFRGTLDANENKPETLITYWVKLPPMTRFM